ncbi:Gfo/Idh/MocA family protein [Microlunatus parietis]|uniref:Putative dehydrogenase n=1 Tax=Microlunatus parietis TaxID=682979 RepID=A0A7Y9LCM5_9ACTN|nr:Gfo/Idh/MocA family oxidoreductase [Microlunatus parietis]NYE72992.1 putative dehydrogenase [Microlunatus parietis]
MTEPRVRRLGVIGLGEGRSMLSAARSSDRWQVAGVCDLDESLIRQRLREFDLDRWTTNYDDLLADPRIDAIAIYTPDHLHRDHCVRALEAGKHVICTKPLLDSLAGADQLLDAARRSPGRLMVGQSTRFFEPMIRQRRDVEAGRHGDVVAVDAHYRSDSRWFLSRDWSTGTAFSWLWNFLIHAVDLVRWYLPDVDEVTGFGTASPNTLGAGLDRPDSLRFVLRDPAGRIATVSGDYTLPKIDQRLEPAIGCQVRGTDGSSRADYPGLTYHTRFAGESPQTKDFGHLAGHYFRFGGTSHHAGEYQNYLDYFATCLDDGIDPAPGPAEAIGTLALLEAMERSMDSGGRPVRASQLLADRNLITQ